MQFCVDLKAFFSHWAVLALLIGPAVSCTAQEVTTAGSYERLVTLFEEWRELEQPPDLNGAPDYTAERFARAHEKVKDFQSRLSDIDISGWPVEQQVDWHLVRAELNGFDFNHRVLKSWVRDPAFYQSVWTYESDTPAHEGPTHHALLELWTYEFPLSSEEEARLIRDLRVIPPLLEQARGNLTGNARDLWVAGIKNLRDQRTSLDGIGVSTGDDASEQLKTALHEAQTATSSFVVWLEEQALSKTGPSGIGKDNYSWYLKNVHYVPLSWDEEVSLLKRELARAHASLRLEEHRNQGLPPLQAISSPEEYDRRANEAVTKYMEFLKEKKILEVRDYYDQAVRERIGEYVPEESRNFFARAIHYEPMTLWTHFYHYFDLAQIKLEPHASPMRRGPLLYNIFDSRSEGLATAVEEMMMHAGLYDDNPRAREVVWILQAQRAARGLASLYVHSNEFTLEQGKKFHVQWTPHSWMRDDLELLGVEQHLYLRQPGYGTSYVTGKHLVERLLGERAEQLGDDFTMARYFAELNAAGVIPMSLVRWQLTGHDDEIQALVRTRQ